MQICLFTLNPAIKEVLISELLFFGVNIVAADSIKETDDLITSENINCLLLDIDGQEELALNFVEALKNDIKTFSMFIIVMTSRQDETLLHRFILEGISGICLKLPDMKQAVAALQSILLILEKETERRQYVRIQPLEEEGLSVLFKKGDRKVAGRIKDISAIAVAAAIQDSEFYQQIQEEQTIKNLSFQIQGREYFCDVLIMRKAVEVRRKEDVVVLGYQNPSLDFKFGLAHYLYQKIHINR